MRPWVQCFIYWILLYSIRTVLKFSIIIFSSSLYTPLKSMSLTHCRHSDLTARKLKRWATPSTVFPSGLWSDWKKTISLIRLQTNSTHKRIHARKYNQYLSRRIDLLSHQINVFCTLPALRSYNKEVETPSNKVSSFSFKPSIRLEKERVSLIRLPTNSTLNSCKQVQPNTCLKDWSSFSLKQVLI